MEIITAAVFNAQLLALYKDTIPHKYAINWRWWSPKYEKNHIRNDRTELGSFDFAFHSPDALCRQDIRIHIKSDPKKKKMRIICRYIVRIECLLCCILIVCCYFFLLLFISSKFNNFIKLTIAFTPFKRNKKPHEYICGEISEGSA